MKKLASTAAAVTRRSWARISHSRGVKLEGEVIALMCPAGCGPGGPPYRALERCATFSRAFNTKDALLLYTCNDCPRN
jgi:hypothetical protein